MAEPRFTVVIPAHNEEQYLPRLLRTIDRAREAYLGRPDSIEVIVVDNSSTDATAQIAFDASCRIVAVEKRVIAAVRNGGARAARGEILTFVDADTQIHPDTFNEIDRVLATGRVIGGATGIHFERRSVGLTVTYWALVVLAVLLGRQFTSNVPTGVVFCWRRDFEQIGGYNENRLFAEDVQFMLDLSRLASTQGRRLTFGTQTKAIFSTRKFDKYGEWHYFAVPFRVAWNLLRRRSFAVSDWARRYWYEDR